MDYICWAKAVLLCAKHFKSIIKNLDITMDTLALTSRAGGQDAQTLMEHAADIIARKTRIINLKVMTADMLGSLPQDMRNLISCRFLLGVGAEQLSRQTGIPLRSLYRRINAALGACAGYLKDMGYDNVYFEERYGGEQWLVSALTKFRGKEEVILRRRDNGEYAAPRPLRSRPAAGGAGV